MSCLLGIDLGTSSVKTMLLNVTTRNSVVTHQNYDVSVPKIMWAEQEPEMWWTKLCLSLKELREKNLSEFDRIEAVGFSGQMHGIVLLDSCGKVLRSAVIWLDQRAQEEVSDIQKKIVELGLADNAENHVSTGFAFSSLVWIKKHEPEIFKNIAVVLSPKDYLRFRLTGKYGTDFSDASATGMFDVAKKTWLWELIDAFEIPRKIFPTCHESTDVAGVIAKSVAREFQIKNDVAVVYGSGDQMAQSIGNGVVFEGVAISNIGTGGQIATFSQKNIFDKKFRTHTFCHAVKNAYTIYGATLCSGLSLKWASKLLGISDYGEIDKMAESVSPGSEGLIYLPYLSGERTPILNPLAKGTFFGLSLKHENAHLLRAVMEGVTFSLKDCINVLDEMGISTTNIIASGGGARSDVWLQMQADIFERTVKVCAEKEQACLGACIVAGVGTGIFENFQTACRELVSFENKIYTPNENNFNAYRKNFSHYKKLYVCTAELMAEM